MASVFWMAGWVEEDDPAGPSRQYWTEATHGQRQSYKFNMWRCLLDQHF